MNKKLLLETLRQEMLADKKLPLKTNLVFGEGDPDCRVLFIGEAPGAAEDELMRPFVGRSGQLLRRHIRQLGWQESDVYITNIVKRRPPNNRAPKPKEIAAYAPYLKRQIDIIKPALIVLLGRFATNFFLPEVKISRDQGKLHAKGDWRLVPMLHPAAALRATRNLKAFTQSFQALPKLLAEANGREIIDKS